MGQQNIKFLLHSLALHLNFFSLVCEHLSPLLLLPTANQTREILNAKQQTRPDVSSVVLLPVQFGCFVNHFDLLSPAVRSAPSNCPQQFSTVRFPFASRSFRIRDPAAYFAARNRVPATNRQQLSDCRTARAAAAMVIRSKQREHHYESNQKQESRTQTPENTPKRRWIRKVYGQQTRNASLK